MHKKIIFKVSSLGLAFLFLWIGCNQKQNALNNAKDIMEIDSLQLFKAHDSIVNLASTKLFDSYITLHTTMFNNIHVARKYPSLVRDIYSYATISNQNNYLNSDAIKHELETLKEFKDLAEASGVEKLKTWSDYFYARYYNDHFQDEVALPKLLSVYQKFLAEQDTFGIAVATKRIGTIYFESYKDYRKSINYFREALSLPHDSEEVSVNALYLVMSYIELGNRDSIKLYLDRTYIKSQNLEAKLRYQIFLYSNGLQDNIDSVNKSLQEFASFHPFNKTDIFLNIIISVYSKYSLALLQKKQYGLAIKALNNVFHYDSLCPTCFKQKVELYHSTYLCYERLKDYKNALKYMNEYNSTVNNLNFEKTKSNIETARVKFEFDKQQQKIALLTKESNLQQAELQKQKTTSNAFIGGLALVALLAGISYNRSRIKHKANAEIENTLAHLKNTQEQLIEREKLVSLGKFTVDVAKQMEVPVSKINQLNIKNRNLISDLKNNTGSLSSSNIEELKTNLKHIYSFGKDADGIVKKVLTETRKVQG